MNKVLDFSSFLNEKINVDSTSGMDYKIILAGASKSKTSNADALKKFTSSKDLPKVTGEISNNVVLKKAKGEPFKTGESSEKGLKNYVKIGSNPALDGDKGEIVKIRTTRRQMMTDGVEAGENGIYAVGRALQTTSNENDFDTPILIALNLDSEEGEVNSFVADAKTGLQATDGLFAYYASLVSMVFGVIVPNPENTTSTVKRAMEIKKSGKGKEILDAANLYVMPRISGTPDQKKEATSKLSGVSKFPSEKVQEVLAKWKDKGIKEGNSSDLDAFVTEYVDACWKDWVTTTSQRFQEYLKAKLRTLRAPENLFDDIFKYINAWRAKAIADKKTAQQAVRRYLLTNLSAAKEGEKIDTEGASGTLAIISGTEGKL